MAWNPSPEVQIARDAAKALSAIPNKQFVNRCIVLFTTIDHQIGYASYGVSPALCGQARRLADEAYKAVHDQHHDILDHHHRHDNKNLTGQGVNWDGIREEVVGKLALLEASLRDMPESDIRHAYVRDLVMPAVELIGRFCACVNVEEKVESGRQG